MRNNSAELLRAVEGGETVQITNHGRVVAVMSPPAASTLERLVAEGKARPPLKPISTLPAPPKPRGKLTTKEILDDIRGSW